MAVLTAAALAATLAVAAAAVVARLSGRGPALSLAPRPGPAGQRPAATSGRRRRWAALGLGAVLGVCRSLSRLRRGRGRFGGKCCRQRGGPSAAHRRGASRGGGREGGGGRGGGRGGAGGGGGGGCGWDPGEASCAGLPRPPAPERWGGGGDDAGGFRGSSAAGSPGGSGGDGGSWQSRPAAFPSGACVAAAEDAMLLECVVRDLEVWESSGQWIFSAYSPWKGKPNVTGFTDLSPEEMRLGYYNCRANSDIQSYMAAVQQLAEQWKNRVRQVKAFYASKKMALLSQLRNVVAQLCVPLDLEDSKPQALDCAVIV